MKIRLFLIVLMASALAGCSLQFFGTAQARTYYVLSDLHEQDSLAEHILVQVTATNTSSSQVYNSQKIVYSTEPTTRGYYQFGSWFEPPTRRFTFLLRRRLEKNSSASMTEKPKSFGLSTELVEFYHDASKDPGVVRILIHAELEDSTTGQMVEVKDFEQVVSAGEFSAAGASDAFSQGVTNILDEMMKWLAAKAK